MLQRQQDPFDAWNFREVVNVRVEYAVRDNYGKLYCYVRALLRSFHRGMRQNITNVRMLNIDARFIRILVKDLKFDRR